MIPYIFTEIDWNSQLSRNWQDSGQCDQVLISLSIGKNFH